VCSWGLHIAVANNRERLMADESEVLRRLDEMTQLIRQLLKREAQPLAATALCFRDAAKALGVGITKLQGLVADGQLWPTTIGKRRMISTSEIERFLRPDPPKSRPKAGRPRARAYDPKEEAQKARDWLKEEQKKRKA
jgi:Helix-turn-helix domain